MRQVHDMLDKKYGDYTFRKLNTGNVHALLDFLNSQHEEDFRFFKPHKIDQKSIHEKIADPAFLAMGVYSGNKIVGYFFLRLFFNKRCFVGRIIDREFRGKGIADSMNKIMYNISWNMNFRCLSTISKNNTAVIKAHERNPNFKKLKDLPNDYMLVEFIKSKNRV